MSTILRKLREKYPERNYGAEPLSIEDVAEQTGLTADQVACAEDGECRCIDTIAKILCVLECSAVRYAPLAIKGEMEAGERRYCREMDNWRAQMALWHHDTKPAYYGGDRHCYTVLVVRGGGCCKDKIREHLEILGRREAITVARERRAALVEEMYGRAGQSFAIVLNDDWQTVWHSTPPTEPRYTGEYCPCEPGDDPTEDETPDGETS